jgi:hypothetical protein
MRSFRSRLLLGGRLKKRRLLDRPCFGTAIDVNSVNFKENAIHVTERRTYQ